MLERAIDHTLLSTVERCGAEAWFRFKQNLTRPESESAALRTGRAVHAGLRLFYDGAPIEACVERVEDDWRGDGAPDELEGEKWRTLDKARKLVRVYADVYPRGKWGFVVMKNEEWVESKEAGVGAVVDRVVQRTDGEVYLMDTKTSGMVPTEATLKQFSFHLQAYLQLTASDAACVHDAAAGFCYDGIYVARRKDVLPTDFTRYWIPYSMETRDLLAGVASKRIAEWKVVEAATSPNGLRRPGACFRYNSICPFYRYCTKSDGDREDMVDLALTTGELVLQEWNPRGAR